MKNKGRLLFIVLASVSFSTGTYVFSDHEHDNDSETQWYSPNYNASAPKYQTTYTPKPKYSVFNRSRHYQNPQSYPVEEYTYRNSYDYNDYVYNNQNSADSRYSNQNSNQYSNQTTDQYTDPYHAQYRDQYQEQTQNWHTYDAQSDN